MAESRASQRVSWSINSLKYSERRAPKLGNIHTPAHSGRVYKVHECIKGSDKSCSEET